MPSIDRQENQSLALLPPRREQLLSLSRKHTCVCSQPRSTPISRHKNDHDSLSLLSPSKSKKQDSAAAAAFPRVERDLLQVEAYASALRQRLARADGGRGDAAAAARLLAHEGVNTRK